MSSGYTLPVFCLCQRDLAALRHLKQQECARITVDLIEPPELTTIEIEQVAKIDDNTAIAITRSESRRSSRYNPQYAHLGKGMSAFSRRVKNYARRWRGNRFCSRTNRRQYTAMLES